MGSNVVYFGEIPTFERIIYLNSRRLLNCADDVNLLDDNLHTIKRNTEALIGASKEIGLLVNHDRRTCSISFENVSQFRYW
jgi:hypothetical protein